MKKFALLITLILISTTPVFAQIGIGTSIPGQQQRVNSTLQNNILGENEVGAGACFQISGETTYSYWFREKPNEEARRVSDYATAEQCNSARLASNNIANRSNGNTPSSYEILNSCYMGSSGTWQYDEIETRSDGTKKTRNVAIGNRTDCESARASAVARIQRFGGTTRIVQITDASLGGLPADPCKEGYCPLVSIPGLTKVGTPVKNPAAYVVGLYRLAIGLGGAVAVILLVYSGFVMMTTESPSVKTIQKDKLTDIALGLGFLLGAYLILSLIDPRLVNVNFDIGKPLSQTRTSGSTNPARNQTNPQAIEAQRAQALQDTQNSYDAQIAAATAASDSEAVLRLTEERDARLQEIRDRQYPAIPDRSVSSSNTNAINTALATGRDPRAELSRVSAEYNNRIQAEQDPVARTRLTEERDNELARLNAFTLGAQGEQAIATGNRQGTQQAAEALRAGRAGADTLTSSDSANWTRAQYASTAQTLLQNCESNPNSCTPQTVTTLREVAAPSGDNAIEAIAGASNDWSNYYRVYDDAATPEYWTYQYSERVGGTVVYKRSEKNNSEFLCNRSRSSMARRVTAAGPILSVDSQCVFGRVNP